MAKQKIQPINGKITIPKLDRMKPTFDFISETTKYENILFGGNRSSRCNGNCIKN